MAGEARLRRPPKAKHQHTTLCGIIVCQAVPSRIAWNRVELYNEVWDQALVKLSRKYGISDVRLGKVCRKLKIPHSGRGYWAKRAVGQTVEQVPLPEFKDAPVVKRLNKRAKAQKKSRLIRSRVEQPLPQQNTFATSWYRIDNSARFIR